MNETLKSDKTELDWHPIDSPKKQTNEFVFFAMTVRKYLKLEISSFKYFWMDCEEKTKTNWFVSCKYLKNVKEQVKKAFCYQRKCLFFMLKYSVITV